MITRKHNERGAESASGKEPDDARRREAMAKLGRLSAATSITVTTLLLSTKATAQSSGLGPPPPPPSPGGGD